jgi:aspartyl-tRNA(Asn)/glutamyl-tRNA(Gln) amidotransferase subunit B
MEKGSLRCDANISVREKGQKQLGRKTELKNMNSFKAVKDALTFEIGRQAELLKRGKSIVQETRLWDAKELKTFSMRTKEEAMDYRYFPEPDLPPFMISPEKIAEIRMAIPELPKEKMQRFIEDYGLLEYDAKVLVLNKNKWDAEYAEALFKAYPPKDKKPVVNLLIGALSASANSRKCSISDLNMPVGNVIELTNYIETQQISNLTANSVLEEMIETKKSAAQIIKEKDLIQISDTNSLNKIIEEVLKENPASAQDYKSGKTNAIMFLVGQAMKKTKGRANPKVVQDILKKLLK